MPAYSHQVSEADRWAIVAYVRALQLNQNPKAFAQAVPAEAGAAEGVDDTDEAGKED